MSIADNNEDEQNIDDLVDYNDFDSKDLDSGLDQDSFNNDILKFYEDHKKNHNAKANEINNAQRPISSYQRVILTDNNKKDTSNEMENKPVEDEGAIITDIDKEMEYDPDEKSESIIFMPEEVDDIIARLHRHLEQYKITKQEFCENENLFVDFSDFREIFKKIKFDIKYRDAKILFSYNNSNKNEGYIHLKNFISNMKLEFKQAEMIEKVRNEFDIKKINDEFNTLRSEIFDIVKKDMIESNIKRLGLKNLKGKGGLKSKGMKDMNFSKSRPLIPIDNSKFNTENKKEKEKFDIDVHLKLSIKKKKDEDLIIKNIIDKRQREFERNCIKKMAEANKMASEIRVSKSFTHVTDKVKNILI